MFSFIKALQSFLEQLKKKKGLWFTILTAISIFGISLSMYLLGNMTSSISKDVYVTMSGTYKNNLEDKLEDKKNEFRRVILSLETNDTFNSNLENKTEIDQLFEKYNKGFKDLGFATLSLVFHSTINQTKPFRNIINSVIGRKAATFGIEILSDGPNLVYFHPIISGDNVIAVVEIKENILSLKSDFERSKQSLFAFLMHERMMNNLSINDQNTRYKLVVDDLRVEEQKYDSTLLANITKGDSLEFRELKQQGYVVNSDFFKTYKEIIDVNGVAVGYIILAEKSQGSNGFVNIVDNVTKSVTLVALGLVISILLFMF